MKPVCFANLKKIAAFSVLGFHQQKYLFIQMKLFFTPESIFEDGRYIHMIKKNTKWDILGIFLFSMKIISQAIKCFGFNGHWNQVFWKQQQVSWKTSVKKQQNADFIFMCFATKAPSQISVVAKHSSYKRVYTVAWAVTGTCTRSRSFNSKCRATNAVISWLEILNKFTIENP